MNKFDRVTSILVYLQTRSVVTAKDLSDRFGVSERTIYRDIRSLETPNGEAREVYAHWVSPESNENRTEIQMGVIR